MIYFLSNCKQQIIAQGNPNLREYCILTRSIERLDIQSFDSFEETFHQLVFSIEFRYSQVGMSEIIAQKSINVTSCIILINNYAGCVRIPFRGLLSCKSNSGITHSSYLLVYGRSSSTSYFMLSLALVTKNAC